MAFIPGWVPSAYKVISTASYVKFKLVWTVDYQTYSTLFYTYPLCGSSVKVTMSFKIWTSPNICCWYHTNIFYILSVSYFITYIWTTSNMIFSLPFQIFDQWLSFFIFVDSFSIFSNCTTLLLNSVSPHPDNKRSTTYFNILPSSESEEKRFMDFRLEVFEDMPCAHKALGTSG